MQSMHGNRMHAHAPQHSTAAEVLLDLGYLAAAQVVHMLPAARRVPSKPPDGPTARTPTTKSPRGSPTTCGGSRATHEACIHSRCFARRKAGLQLRKRTWFQLPIAGTLPSDVPRQVAVLARGRGAAAPKDASAPGAAGAGYRSFTRLVPPWVGGASPWGSSRARPAVTALGGFCALRRVRTVCFVPLA